MGLKLFIYVLLCAASTTLSGVSGENGSSEASRWTRQSLPALHVTHTAVLDTPPFKGQEEDEERGGTKAFCGIECQSSLPLMDQREQERILGYETMYDNGTRVHTDVSLQGLNETSVEKSSASSSSSSSSSRTRRKRQVYGADGRFVISGSNFVTNYPFSTAVRLSTGCSGVLVSPKHVLTAARCLHDGNDYLGGARGLRVGVLQLKTKRRRGGRRRGGGRRGGRRGTDETREEKRGGEGEEMNTIAENVVRGRNAGRRRGRRGPDNERRGRGKESPGRSRRSAGDKRGPVFRWARVKQIQIPQGWILTKSAADSVSSDYNYALLELRRPLRQKHMELGVAPPGAPPARIHFSGYDDDKSLRDGGGEQKVVYRFCSVAKESDDLMYQHCDARDGAAGAGVYVRLRGEAGQRGRWQRRVIGVYSGHEWVEEEGGEQRDFNVAVRITPPKYAQICHWIHGDPSLCKEV